jgi:hypothetical protein
LVAPTPEVIEPTPELIDPTSDPTPEVIEPTPEPIDPIAPFRGAVRPRRCACASGVPRAASSNAAAAKKEAK